MDYDNDKIYYVQASTTTLSLIQTVIISTYSGPTGVNFIIESIALVIIRTSGIIQKYTLTSTSAYFDSIINTASNWQTITFFPGSKS